MDESDQLQAELKALCQPLSDWLQKNYTLMHQIIITPDYAIVLDGELGVPLEVMD